MASENHVRQYLAYWFQLGKKVLIRNGQEALQPKKVFNGNQYSNEFEECWQKITSPSSGDCYLQGTNETIAQLLTPAWELMQCARCTMPIPMATMGMPPEACPCNDLSNWPNSEVPAPREAVNSQNHLNSIRSRLIKTNSRVEDQKYNEAAQTESPALNMPIPLEMPICNCPDKTPNALNTSK